MKNNNSNIKSFRPKYLVISGGGIKVMCVTGILPILERLKILSEVSTFAGTSAGGFIALLCVLGFSSSEISSILFNTNFNEFMKNINFLRLLENDSLANEKWIENYFEKIISLKGFSPIITMKELYEKTKKSLIVYACKETNLDVVKIDHISYPNLLVKDAIYMTCTVPVLISPKQLNGINMIDGGVVKNYPINDFPLDETLGIRFIIKKNLSITTSPSLQTFRKGLFPNYSSPLDLLTLLVEKVINNAKRIYLIIFQIMDKLEILQLQNLELYEIPCILENINTLDFSIDKETKKVLFVAGAKACENFLSSNCQKSLYKIIYE